MTMSFFKTFLERQLHKQKGRENHPHAIEGHRKGCAGVLKFQPYAS